MFCILQYFERCADWQLASLLLQNRQKTLCSIVVCSRSLKWSRDIRPIHLEVIFCLGPILQEVLFLKNAFFVKSYNIFQIIKFYVFYTNFISFSYSNKSGAGPDTGWISGRISGRYPGQYTRPVSGLMLARPNRSRLDWASPGLEPDRNIRVFQYFQMLIFTVF